MKLIYLLLLIPSLSFAETKVTINELAPIVSSSTIIPATYSTTQATFAQAVTGSTITITTSGNSRVMVNFSGLVYNDTASGECNYGFGIDGVVFKNSAWGTTLVNERQGHFTVITDTLAAGTHSFYMVMKRATAGTCNVYVAAGYANQFWVTELR